MGALDPFFNRRNFLLAGIFFFAGIIIRYLLRFFFLDYSQKHTFIRPPGTTDEGLFLERCIRCRACANVCEAGCINFFSFAEAPLMAGTPYINPRMRSCNLCMSCTQVCPTGALEPIPMDLEVIKEKVDMGLAVVVKSNCLSYNGRVCGICHDACPVAAIKLEPVAKPVVIEDVCVGCGRCEERCPITPNAIPVRRKDIAHV